MSSGDYSVPVREISYCDSSISKSAKSFMTPWRLLDLRFNCHQKVLRSYAGARTVVILAAWSVHVSETEAGNTSGRLTLTMTADSFQNLRLPTLNML